MTAFLRRFLNVRREEIAPLFVAIFFHFFALTALMMLRPARDALGMKEDLDKVRWLFVGTAVVTLAVNPIFGWLVSRFRRITFITATYGFFAASLVGFSALLTLTPEAIGNTTGRVFYIWFSVFNLFCTMVFWALMVDRFTLEQSKRLFGAIAVGGTLGAIAGPWLAKSLAKPLGTPALLIVAAGVLLLAVVSAWLLVWIRPDRPHDVSDAETAAEDRAVIGGHAWQGIVAVVRSPYLLGIAGYMFTLSVIATWLYFTRLDMVALMKGTTDERTATFAYLDVVTQTSTLVLQLIVTGHIMKRLGVAVALMLLPVMMAAGFIGLAIVGSLTALVVLDSVFKAVQRAIMRPARETLFTVVSREDKYKSKAVTDTFVYRGGDVVGAWSASWIGLLGMALSGLAAIAVPVSIAWGVLGLWLGRQQKFLAIRPSDSDTTAPSRPSQPSLTASQV